MVSLNEIVERYCKNKDVMATYDKQVKADNKLIKELIITEGTNSGDGKFTASGGGYTVTYSVIESQDFDEEKLIDTLKHVSVDGISAEGVGLIKYKPTVDMEVLENLIYNGKIDAAKLASCKTVKKTEKLTYKKEK